MPLLDVLFSVLAPHLCLVCGREGALVCNYCLPDAFLPVPSRCYRCKRLTMDFATCQTCRRRSPLRHVFVGTDYEKTAKELVYALKFKRARAAAGLIALSMQESLPFFNTDMLIVPVPTATSRSRERGYDQSVLLACAIARSIGAPYGRVMTRLTQTRQVGAHRQKRLEQLKDAFYVPRSASVRGKHVLLVDDVTTTGATLEAAARTLKRAGAKRIDAVVFASKQ